MKQSIFKNLIANKNLKLNNLKLNNLKLNNLKFILMRE
jgi:hypothetical protein